jgi:hypothetical protein
MKSGRNCMKSCEIFPNSVFVLRDQFCRPPFRGLFFCPLFYPLDFRRSVRDALRTYIIRKVQVGWDGRRAQRGGERLASSGALINGAWRKDRVQILIFFQRDPQVVWLIVTEAYAHVESQQRISVWPALYGLSICMLMSFTTSVRMAMRMRCQAFLCSCRHLFTLMLLKRTCGRLLLRLCIQFS